MRINESHFHKLSLFLGINENELYQGTYNRELARKRVYGSPLSLPERYEKNRHGFLRSSAHILRYVVLTRGQAFADRILQNLSLSPLIYSDINTPVNLTYFADLLTTLASSGFSQAELDTLASVMFLSMQGTKLGQKFQASKNHFEVYKNLAENFSYFDSNFEYRSEFVGKKYLLKTTLPLDEHQNIKNNPQALNRLLRYRHILLAWFPYLADLAPTFPQVETVHLPGQLEIHYKIDIQMNPKQPSVLELLS